MQISGIENVTCGCMTVFENQPLQKVFFEVNKELLSPEDAGTYDISILLSDKSGA